MMEENLHIRTKKAVSPLVATVLLIAFAVALGAVALTIATNLFRENVDCNDVQISLRTGPSGQPPICVGEDVIHMYVRNDAVEDIPLDNIKLIITGGDGQPYEYAQTFNNPDGTQSIGSGSYKLISQSYSVETMGEIQEVIIIPVVKSVIDDPKSEPKYCTKAPTENSPGQIIHVGSIPKC